MVNVQKYRVNNQCRWGRRWGAGSRRFSIRVILMAVIVSQLLAAYRLSYAQDSSLALHISQDDRSLQIAAEGADLKNVLSALASAANIAITYPIALDKKVYLDKRGLSVGEALKLLLKGMNHVIIYSGPSAKKANVKKVLVLGKKTKRQPISQRKARQLNQRIKAYQRQIESLKRRLAKLDPNSQRGKRYLKRINRLESSIEGLQRQMY